MAFFRNDAINRVNVHYGVHAFAEAMIEQGTDAAIINTGSKQGITNPPDFIRSEDDKRDCLVRDGPETRDRELPF